MRNLLLLPAILVSMALWAQQEVRITDGKALSSAQDVRKVKGAQEGLQKAGFPQEEIGTIMEYGDLSKWPEGIRTDTARTSNGPYIINYAGFRLCRFTQDTAEWAVVMVPAAYNLHMPDVMRPIGDFYLALPDQVLADADKPKARPAVSRGPRWENRPKAKIIKADGLYGAYVLAGDSTGLKALERRGLSKAEIDAVIFRSTERNWPEGIDSYEKRETRQKKFHKYRAYLGATWGDKVLLIVPTAKNKHMPAAMRPYMDLYFVYSTDAVKVAQRK